MNVHGNEMTLMHFHDFYYLEALKAGIAMAKTGDNQFRRSFERLESDVNEAFDHLCETMAKRIHTYIWAACLGEVRHAADIVSTYIPEIYGGSRDAVYRNSYKYVPNEANMQVVRDVYAQSGWGNTYGGKKWLDVTDGMMLFGKVNHATFIDHAVDLEHNGGNIFTKDASVTKLVTYFEGYDASDLRMFLDYKFAKDILNEKSRRYDNTKVSRKVYSFAVRYNNIVAEIKCLSFLSPELDWLSDYSVDYLDGVLTTSESRATDDDCTCDNCEETCDHTHTVDGEGQEWCCHCFANYQFTCPDCNKEYHVDHKVKSEDGWYLCEDCAEDNTCEVCDEIHYNDMGEHTEEHELESDEQNVDEQNETDTKPETETEVGYSWLGDMFHTTQSSEPEAQAQICKDAGANYTYILKEKTFTVKTGNHNRPRTNEITMKVYTIPGSSLFVYHMGQAQIQMFPNSKKKLDEFAIMTPSGFHIQGTKDLYKNIVTVHKIDDILDWNEIKTQKDVENIPADKKEIISTIVYGG